MEENVRSLQNGFLYRHDILSRTDKKPRQCCKVSEDGKIFQYLYNYAVIMEKRRKYNVHEFLQNLVKPIPERFNKRELNLNCQTRV